jgi:ribosomal protein S18 acetylase RimI-like enzyme
VSKPSPIAVRQASVADRLALLSEHRGNPIYHRLRPDARQRAHTLFRSQLQSANEIILLAIRDRSHIGILRCVDALGSPLLYPSRYGYVTSVYVLPAARRTGVLRTLFDEAERWCRVRGLTEMRLHNAPDNPLACAAWEALGFDVVEELRHRPIRRV